MYQDTTWYAGGLSLGDIVLDGVLAPPPLKGHSVKFSANVCCGQTAGWSKMPLGTKVGLGPVDYVFDGNPAHPIKRGTAPTQFLAHVYCGQTTEWVKMPLTTEVNLGSWDVVLDGVPTPPKRNTAPRFSAHVCCGKTAILMKTPLGTEVNLGPGHVVLDGDPDPPRKGHNSPALIGPCPLWPRSPISAATAELL